MTDERADPRQTWIDFMQMKSFVQDPLVLTEGDGVFVKDTRGHRYLDGLSGTFCANLGHGNIRIATAAHEQMRRLAMAGPTLATNDRALGLVHRLLGLLPAGYSVVKLFSGGSEATEAAIKTARQYHKQTGAPAKYKVLSHYRSYHGATGYAMAASGWPLWRTPYEPLAPGFVHLHTPDPYHSPLDGNETTLGRAYARLVEETIEFEDPRTIAALITEPILTSAGAVVPPPDYLPALRELCDRNNILLIFDEIITGFGRVGDLFAAHLFDTWPDIFCFGKGMSGGYAPLSAVVMTDKVAAPFWGEPEDLSQFHSGHTYGANPVACAVGLATIDEILERNLCENARDRGAQTKARLRALMEAVPTIGHMGGEGLLLGVEFVRDRETRSRFSASMNVGVRIRDAARKRGLLVRASHWMLVLAPPLTISAAEVDEMMDIVEDSIHEVLGPVAARSAPAASGM